MDVGIVRSPLPSAASQQFSQEIAVTGPLGALRLPLPPFVSVNVPETAQEDTKRTCQVTVMDPKNRKQRAMWGTARALIQNMVEGVSEGFVLPLRFEGVGYRVCLFLCSIVCRNDSKKCLKATIDDQGRLSMRLGYAHPVVMEIPAGVKVSIPAPQRVLLQGIDKQVLTQFAASIRKWRKPEPYNQKGIFVGDETIKKKEGKKR